MAEKNGFGDWFANLSEEESRQDAGSGSGSGAFDGFWSQFGFLGGASEEGGGEPDPESQGFLSSRYWPTSLVGESPNDGGGRVFSAGSSPQNQTIMGLSYATRFKGFVATVVLSGLFFFLAFSVGLPVIVFRPHKFALCFTLGSIMFMSSFALLKGPMAHLRSICSRDRLQFTSAYLGSMALTLYSALIVRSYILVIITSSLQMTTLCYYFLSYIPGGTTGARIFLTTFVKTVRMAIGPCMKGMFQFFQCCLKAVSS